MKRKLFSAILFGALLTASTSGLTSCKDYDDDISNLQSQIDKLATADQLSAKVAEMQAAISAAQSAAEAKAAAAQTVADAAKSAAADAAAAASKAQSTADGASQAAKDAAAAAAAADEVAKAAQKAIEALEAKAATKDELKAAADAAEAAVKAIQDAHAKDVEAINKAINDGLDAVKAEIAETNKKLDALDVRLKAVEDKLAAIEAGEGQEEALKAIQEEVEDIADALEDIIGEYTSMVTEVSLYASEEFKYENSLKFVYVPQEKTTKFPAAEGVADEQIVFSADNKNVTTTDNLLVRVSPTNAVLNAANISLLNSQGADLSEYVEVKSVKPYNELIVSDENRTRSVEGNGLWNVEFKVKDGADVAKLAEAVTVKKGTAVYGIKFAVAVQNTESDETRRVISAYDVEVLPEEYEPARNNITISNRDGKWTDIAEVKNRYQYKDGKPAGAICEDKTEDTKVKELAWENEPQVAGATTGIINAAESEARSDENFVDVEVGQDINIFIGNVYGEKNPVNATATAVKGFYVTLDKDFALESAPSEWNAWSSYSYTNVGVPGDSKRPAKMFYGNEGVISIDSQAALADKIGFRVYVVNLDGTLVDPDGRAFYVNVATEKVVTKVSSDELVAEIQPGDATKGEYKYAFNGSNYTASASVTDAAKTALDKANNISGLEWTVTKNASAYGNNIVVPVSGIDYSISFSDKNRKVTLSLLKPYMFLDEGSYTAQATLKNANGTEICDLSIEFKKAMPAAAPVLAWNSIYDPTKQIFANAGPSDANIYKVNKGAFPQAVEMNDLIEFLWYGDTDNGKDHSWYTLEFANAKKNAQTGKYTDALQVPANAPSVSGPANVDQINTGRYERHPAMVTSYKLEPNVDVIDGKSHEIAYKYNFGWISLTYDYQTGKYAMGPWVKYAEKNLAMTFASWIHYENVAWAKDQQPTLTYIPGAGETNSKTFDLLGTEETTETVTEEYNGLIAMETGIRFMNIGTGSVNKLPEGVQVYRKHTDGNWYLFDLKAVSAGTTIGTGDGYGGSGNYRANANNAWIIKSKVTGKYTHWVQGDAQNAEYIKLNTKLPYVKDDHNITGTTEEFIYIDPQWTNAKYVKAAADGYYYEVKYLNNSWTFINPVTKNPVSESALDSSWKVDVDLTASASRDKHAFKCMIDKIVTVEAGKSSMLVAWNTVIRNYQSGKSMFGESGEKPVDFITLKKNDYIKNITVTPDSSSPFNIAFDETNGTLKFVQKVGQLNPGNESSFTITAEDCFGKAKSWTLVYKIKQ